MKYIMRSLSIGLLVLVYPLQACYGPNTVIEFAENELFVPARLGPLSLYKDGDGFHVINGSTIYDVQSCFCDRTLRTISNEQLVNFLGRNKPQLILLSPEEFSQLSLHDTVELTNAEQEKLLNQLFHRGYISINQMSDGEYTLHAETGLAGGGWFGKIAKWGLYGAVGCVAVVGAGAAVAGLAGGLAIVGPVSLLHSALLSTSTLLSAAGVAGTNTLIGASVLGYSASVGIPTVAIVGAAGGVATAALTGTSSAARPQADNPAAGTAPVPTFSVNEALDDLELFA
ncbi:MAG: hypothetical protein WCW33_04620 [Candidatus Babeliales bacterium]|jgi:hypothetical protein